MSGCGTRLSYGPTDFILDMTLTPQMPFSARHFPSIYYNAPDVSELYLLLIMDVGFGYSHGIIANIPGNRVDQGLVSDFITIFMAVASFEYFVQSLENMI